MKFRKGQSSVEFIVLISLAAVFVIMLVIVSAGQINEINKKKEYNVVKDLALKVQSEVNIASNAVDGYSRNFEIPEFIDYINFTINVNGTHVLVESKNANYFLFIPETIGQINIGNNIIRKSEGVVYLNS